MTLPQSSSIASHFYESPPEQQTLQRRMQVSQGRPIEIKLAINFSRELGRSRRHLIPHSITFLFQVVQFQSGSVGQANQRIDYSGIVIRRQPGKQLMTDPIASEFELIIVAVLPVLLVQRFAIGNRGSFGHGKERPKDGNASGVGRPRPGRKLDHSHQAVQAGTPQDVLQHGFRLVVGGVSHRYCRGSLRQGDAVEEAVAHLAGDLLEGRNPMLPLVGERVFFFDCCRQAQLPGQAGHELSILVRFFATDVVVQVGHVQIDSVPVAEAMQ